MIAVYLGVADETQINNMSIPFFDDVMRTLGKKVNYDAVVNFAGNAFAKDSWKIIQEASPIRKEHKAAGLEKLIASTPIKIMDEEDFGDLDW